MSACSAPGTVLSSVNTKQNKVVALKEVNIPMAKIDI